MENVMIAALGHHVLAHHYHYTVKDYVFIGVIIMLAAFGASGRVRGK